MNIVVERSCRSVGRERWNAVLSGSATNTIFQTYSWHCAFEAAYSARHTGYILCGMEGDDLAGIAPFCLCNGGGGSVVRFLGYERADYCDLIYAKSKKEFVAAVFSFLKSRSGEWDRIELANIPEQSPTLGLISATCKENRLISSLGNRIPCPALVFNDQGRPFEEFLEKKSIVRHHRYFSKRPDFRVSHFTLGEEIAPRLRAFFDQHIARWSATDFPSLFLESVHREFYEKLAVEIGDDGGLLFTELFAESHPIAFHFGFRYNGKLIWYKPSFDIMLAGRSPGEALLKELMVLARKDGLDELDFTIGDEAFKRRFSNVIRYNSSVHVFKNPVIWVSTGMRRLIKTGINGSPSVVRTPLLSAAETVKETGSRGAVKKALAALKLFLYQNKNVMVYMRCVNEPVVLETVSGRENVEVRMGALEDAIRFTEKMSIIARHNAVRDAVRRIRCGETLFAAIQGDTIAGIAWVSAAASMNLPEIGYRLEIPKDSIFLTVWTAAEQSLTGHIFMLLLDSISAKFQGKSKIICCGEINMRSRHDMEPLFIRNKVIRMVSVCGIRLHFVRQYIQTDRP